MTRQRGLRARPRGLLDDAELIKRAISRGAKVAKVIDPKEVVTAPWVRWKCQFGCDGFNSSLCCPPNSPAPEETRKMLDHFSRAVVFEASRGTCTRIAAALEREFFLEGYYKAFGLGAGPCELCDSCAMDQGCRRPHEARPSMEACGIDVFSTVRRQGFQVDVVRTKKDPQHYFGLVLVE